MAGNTTHVIATIMAFKKCMLHCVPLLNNNTNLISLSPTCITTAIEFISKYILLELQPYKHISDTLKHLLNDSQHPELFQEQSHVLVPLSPSPAIPLTSTPTTSTAAASPASVTAIVCHLQCYKRFCHKKTLTQASRKRKVCNTTM